MLTHLQQVKQPESTHEYTQEMRKTPPINTEEQEQVKSTAVVKQEAKMEGQTTQHIEERKTAESISQLSNASTAQTQQEEPAQWDHFGFKVCEDQKAR